MGIVDEDVVEDYVLSAPLMKDIRDRMTTDPETAPGVKDLPDFQWETSAESMLVDRLKVALLVSEGTEC